MGCTDVTQQVFSRMLNTGIQYLPVDSMQTSEQEYFASQSARSRSPLENEEKRACLYSVRPLASVIPIQAKIHVLWTSSPQQFLRRILKATLNLLHIRMEKVRQGLVTRQNRVDLKEISLRATLMRQSLMPERVTEPYRNAGLPLYSPVTHLHGLCSIPNTPVDSIANKFSGESMRVS